MIPNSVRTRPAWLPDLFGPTITKESVTLQKAMNTRTLDKQIHYMACFVPDQIVYAGDLSAKSFQTYPAVLMLLNISTSFAMLFKKYSYDKNGGSLVLTKMLYNYIHTMSHAIYTTKGDLLKFSAEGILAMWKISEDELLFRKMQGVIANALNLQKNIASFKNGETYKVNVIIAVGDVTFSVIGDDKARHFVIFGTAIEELKHGKKISLPHDLIISSSAWQHCTPSQYDYVIKDAYNVKVTRIKEKIDITLPDIPESVTVRFALPGGPATKLIEHEHEEEKEEEEEEDEEEEEVPTTITRIIAVDPYFDLHLRSYSIKPVLYQIQKGKPLKFLAELRRLTVVSVDIIPKRLSITELIHLVDKCFLLLLSIVTQYAGCINMANLYERNIFFCVVFGLREYYDEIEFKHEDSCKNGITCAMQILQKMRDIDDIQATFVGVSTGMAYCGVIGHARKTYAIVGPPINKAVHIMDISYNKVSCDYNTVMNSRLSKDKFRSRGIRTLEKKEKCHVYEYTGDTLIGKDVDATSSLDYCYPILGKTNEVACFDDILDEIGVAGRTYSGLVIEGGERSGKSRLLDAFVSNVLNRQIIPITLSLHVTYADKDYAVIYHIILKLLDAEDCDTIEDREKVLLIALGDVLALKDFCYLNSLMRVRFSLSDIYCSDTDRERRAKAINIFEIILKQLKIKVCILLDDIQYIDDASWHFLSTALDHDNVVIAMTISKQNSWKELSHVGVNIGKDKRLMKRTINDLDLDLLPALACQYLNVFAISRKLNRVLQTHRKDCNIGWCEAFLTLVLQNHGLNFMKISPKDVKLYDLVFPNASLITKLPVDMTPEEFVPPSWSQMDHVDICVVNEEFFEISKNNLNRNITELMIEIFNSMNPYEQSFITCAATLGQVFKRNALQNVMPNAILPYTTKAISEMIRIRILECAALQRRDFKESRALVFCIHKKRRTFSDMHHLVTCYCHQSRRAENDVIGDCNILEFKVNSFRKVMYDIQTNEKKREHHARAARLYIRDARKCYTCGSTNFLRVPSKDVLMEAKQRESVTYRRGRKTTLYDESERKHSIRPERGKLTVPKVMRKESDRRMSILPSPLDDDETKSIRQEDVKKSKRRLTKFWKRRRDIAPEITEETFHPSYLEDFTYIDYRNCQCESITTFLFWELYRHIENSGEIHKILDILLEYSAGLIQTAQPLYAVKLLSIADEKNGIEISKANDNAEDHVTKKGIILALTGDAYSALGNYAQAKTYYTAAAKLRDVRPKMLKAVCYTMVSRLYCTEENTLCRPVKVTGRPAVLNLELASYLRRLSIAFSTEDRWKTAQWLALRSFKLAFLSVGSFLEKGEVYLATVQVLLHSRNFEIVRYIERPLVNVIDAKISWNSPEEVTTMANIYLMMFQIRALSGKLQEAIDIGIKVWKISEALHLNALILTFVPSLIQIMLWTQHITEAVDLMRELYFLAEDDVDLSAKTWYYALSLELILDAGIVIETYEKSYNYYKEVLAHKSITCVWRDPQSLYRLLTCLWMYQLRMGYTILHAVMYSADEYMKDVTCHDFSRIVCCIKGLECYLMLLLRCINTKHSNELQDRLRDIRKLIKFLKNIANHALIIKPRLYLLLAYFNVLRGRKSSTRFYLRKAQKFANSQGNKLIQAWIMQNTRTWKENVYNNMARYWLEYAGSTDFVGWQHIRTFSIETWSTILYPLPTPDSHL